MIRFKLHHLSPGSDSLEGKARNTIEKITPKLEEAPDPSVWQIDVSVEEAIAVTLIDIRQTLARMLEKMEAAFPDAER